MQLSRACGVTMWRAVLVSWIQCCFVLFFQEEECSLLMGTNKYVSAIQAVSVSITLSESHETEILFAFVHSLFPEAMHNYFWTLTCIHIYWYIYSHWLGVHGLLIHYGVSFASFLRWQNCVFSGFQNSLPSFSSLLEKYSIACASVVAWGSEQACN